MFCASPEIFFRLTIFLVSEFVLIILVNFLRINVLIPWIFSEWKIFLEFLKSSKHSFIVKKMSWMVFSYNSQYAINKTRPRALAFVFFNILPLNAMLFLGVISVSFNKGNSFVLYRVILNWLKIECLIYIRSVSYTFFLNVLFKV